MVPLTISFAETLEEREEAVNFGNQVALEWHKCLPPPPPRFLFIARQNGAVVGTLGVELSYEEELPLEKIYDFKSVIMPWPFIREEMMQIGRWAARVRGVSEPMNYAAVLWSIFKGRRYGCSEVKEKIALRLREMGIEVRIILGARLKIEVIPPEGREYYLTNPCPKPCMVSMVQMESALRCTVESAIRTGEVHFSGVLNNLVKSKLGIV